MTDLSDVKTMTDHEDYIDGDREGYDVEPQGVGEGIQVTYSVVHTETGRGLGAYATLADVDARIAKDREYLANLVTTDEVPELAAVHYAEATDI